MKPAFLTLACLTPASLKRTARAAYPVAAAATTLGAVTGRERLHAAAKYALAPLLMAEVAAGEHAWSTPRRDRTITQLVGLVGSAWGDHVMLGESRATGGDARRQMRQGAASFSAQQTALLALMHEHGLRFERRDVALVLGGLAGLGVLDAVTGSSNSALPDPVLTGYAVLLTSMAVLAQHSPRTRPFGMLFLASDAVIVARQLLPAGWARNAADGVVMGTYATALAGLVCALEA